jgi:hypothetical protein
MSILNGKKGTPLGSPHLCKSCNWGQFMTGYRDSDRLAVCTNTSPNMVVPFAMLECSGFSDRNRPDYDQMKKLAIDIRPGQATSRTAGFSTNSPLRRGSKPRADQDEDEYGLASVQ